MSSSPPAGLPGRIYRAARPVVLVAIVAYLLYSIFLGWEELRSIELAWRPFSAVAAFVVALLAFQCLFAAWILILHRTGLYRSGNVLRYARVWWVSFMFRYVPGKVALLVERANLGKEVGIPPATGGMLAIVETLISILGGSAVSLLTVLYYVDGGVQLPVAVGVLTIGLVLVFPRLYRAICHLPAVRRRFPDLQTAALRGRDVLTVAIPYIGYYLLLGLSLFLIVRSLYPLDWKVLPGICGIYALSHVIGLVTVLAPAGLGVREGAFALQLDYLMPSASGSAIAIGARAWFTLVELATFGFVVMITRSPKLSADQRNRDSG